MCNVVLPISDPSATHHYRASSLSRWRGAWQVDQCAAAHVPCLEGDNPTPCAVCPFDRAVRGTFDAHKMHWAPPLRNVAPWNRRRPVRRTHTWWRGWRGGADACRRMPDELCVRMDCHVCADHHGVPYLTPAQRRKRWPARP